jgi:hypothetical protein
MLRKTTVRGASARILLDAACSGDPEAQIGERVAEPGAAV